MNGWDKAIKKKIYFRSQFQTTIVCFCWFWACGKEEPHGGEYSVDQAAALIAVRRWRGTECKNWRNFQVSQKNKTKQKSKVPAKESMVAVTSIIKKMPYDLH